MSEENNDSIISAINSETAPLAALGDVREWCTHQLESAIRKLTEKVSIITYTRNPEALAACAKQCDELDCVLTACEFQLQHHAETDSAYQRSLAELLIVEAHQMLADARALVRVPLQPVKQAGNVIALKPNYSDLTDAAFERMLASSDIPQFLTTPANWQDEFVEPGQQEQAEKPRLQLVYSRSES